MKNYEKYADKIKKYKDSKDEYFCNEFIIPHILKKDSCADISCEHCHILQMTVFATNISTTIFF